MDPLTSFFVEVKDGAVRYGRTLERIDSLPLMKNILAKDSIRGKSNQRQPKGVDVEVMVLSTSS